jgi:hypothetical protein
VLISFTTCISFKFKDYSFTVIKLPTCSDGEAIHWHGAISGMIHPFDKDSLLLQQRDIVDFSGPPDTSFFWRIWHGA